MQFLIDPFLGTRVPFAAIVEQDGRLRMARAAHIPGPECLGGVGAHALLRGVSDLLGQITSFDDLPGTFGPHFMLGEPLPVPAGVENAIEWVVAHVLPRQIAEAAAERRGEWRSTQGYTYLERIGVARFVKKRFRPSTLFGTSHLPPISHYVGDVQSGLLLMEPLVVAQPSFDRDLATVETSFSAYRYRLEQMSSPSVELIAYVLPQTAGWLASEYRSVLKSVAHEVFDLSNADEQAVFRTLIEGVGGKQGPRA